MFGCYHRTEAADPDTYVAAVALVLAHYPVEIVKAVTDPYGGLPSRKKENGYSGLPDVADVKEACESEGVRLARMVEYAALPKPVFSRMAPVRREPGAFATIFVPPEAPQYPRMLARSKKSDVDPREWRYDETRQGLWVCFSWLDGSQMEMKRFEPFTDEQLRAHYGAPAANGG